jgi:hypothetical protein
MAPTVLFCRVGKAKAQKGAVTLNCRSIILKASAAFQKDYDEIVAGGAPEVRGSMNELPCPLSQVTASYKYLTSR